MSVIQGLVYAKACVSVCIFSTSLITKKIIVLLKIPVSLGMHHNARTVRLLEMDVGAVGDLQKAWKHFSNAETAATDDNSATQNNDPFRF